MDRLGPGPLERALSTRGAGRAHRGQMPKLTLKWAFGFPTPRQRARQPTVAGGRLFVGSQSGAVYALDAKTGCTIWAFQAKAGVRTAIVIGPRPAGRRTLRRTSATAARTSTRVDAATGELIWTRQARRPPAARHHRLADALSGSPVRAGGVGRGRDRAATRSTSAARSAAASSRSTPRPARVSGRPTRSRPSRSRSARTRRRRPAGGRRAPASGPRRPSTSKRRVVYAATGNMYTEPQQPTSDAVMAFDLDTGKIVWTAQVTPNDVFVVGCSDRPRRSRQLSAERGPRPRLRLRQPPMLATLPGGRDLIVIGQKSGVGWALDPDKKGAVVWQYRAGEGSALGGMEWGSAARRRTRLLPACRHDRLAAGRAACTRSGSTPASACGSRRRRRRCAAPVRGCTPAHARPRSP